MNRYQFLEKLMLHNAHVETRQINVAIVMEEPVPTVQCRHYLEANELSNDWLWPIADEHYRLSCYPHWEHYGSSYLTESAR